MKNFNRNKESIGITHWLRDYAKNAGSVGYVVGLSGGIDSTLVARLAVNAVGAPNVIGVIMPIHSPVVDEIDAYKVALHLGIKTIYVDLKPTYDIMIKISKLDLGRLEKANIKARLRMTALYAVAGKRNMLVAGTGNKSENMIGYFTKHGDGAVDVLPIAEYYKWEVKEIAKCFGIPIELVERTPTAALWEGQTDEDEIGMSYEVLDKILYYLETGEEYPDIDILHADKVEKVKKMIKDNKHKTEYPPSYRRK